jgi:hypothetical protein
MPGHDRGPGAAHFRMSGQQPEFRVEIEDQPVSRGGIVRGDVGPDFIQIFFGLESFENAGQGTISRGFFSWRADALFSETLRRSMRRQSRCRGLRGARRAIFQRC